MKLSKILSEIKNMSSYHEMIITIMKQKMIEYHQNGDHENLNGFKMYLDKAQTIMNLFGVWDHDDFQFNDFEFIEMLSDIIEEIK